MITVLVNYFCVHFLLIYTVTLKKATSETLVMGNNFCNFCCKKKILTSCKHYLNKIEAWNVLF